MYSNVNMSCENEMESTKIKKILDLLEIEYPDADCALNHENAFELLVATMLSAQTTDKSVNVVTPDLFKAYPTPKAMAEAEQSDIEKYIRRIGLYRNKAKNLIAMSQKLCEDFGGVVPSEHDKLTSLPGVGRKTANVVMAVWFGIPRFAVDTHVFRVANRIGLAKAGDVLKTEIQLMENIPKERWTSSHHSLIFHGRNCCSARNPNCDECVINELCEKNNLK